MEGLNVAQVACGHSHTLMVVTGQNAEQLNKLAKFKPKPPKVGATCAMRKQKQIPCHLVCLRRR